MKPLIQQIKDLLGTDAKAASVFGVSLRTFQRWKQKGEFPKRIYGEKALSIIERNKRFEEVSHASEV